MFLGTTTVEVRDYLARELRSLKPTKVFEPCAGNFVVSMLCGAIDKKITVRSGDVSLYSVAVGCGLGGIDSGIRLRESLEEEYPGFAGKTSPEEVAALAIIFLELALYRKKMHIKYYANLERDIRSDQAGYFDLVLKKVQAAKALLGDFRFVPMDCFESILEAKAGDVVFFDPPYFSGKSDDYAKCSAALAECFHAPRIPFTEVTDELRIAALKDMSARGCIVYYRPEDEVEIEGFEKCFQFEYRANKNYLVYSNRHQIVGHGRRILMPEKPTKFDVVFEDTEFGPDAKLEVVPVDAKTANHYRLMWTKKAAMKNLGRSFAVIVDGVIAGVVAIEPSLAFGSRFAVIVSDAAPHHTKYRRLGRLVLYAILNKEFLSRINDLAMHEHTGYTTVAYTNAAVSMKYRGLFELVKREKGDGIESQNRLIYRTEEMQTDTIQEAYRKWYGKHGKDFKGKGGNGE